jgi:pilus assembly protein CpaB
VLASGRDTGAPQRPGDRSSVNNSGSTVSQVTISVTLEQAEVLALAQEQGRLTLVLRNPDDIAVIENLPETTSADIVEPVRRERVQHRQAPVQEEPRLPQRVQ